MQAKKLMMAMAIIVFSCFLAAANKSYARQPNDVPGTAKWVLDVAAGLPDSYSELAIDSRYDSMYYAVGNKLMVVDLGCKRWSTSNFDNGIFALGRADLMGKLSVRTGNKIKRKLRPVRGIINPEPRVLYECKKNDGRIKDLAIDKNGVIYLLELYDSNRFPVDKYPKARIVALHPRSVLPIWRFTLDDRILEDHDSHIGMAIDGRFLYLAFQNYGIWKKPLLYYIWKKNGRPYRQIAINGNELASGPVVGPGNNVYLVYRDLPSNPPAPFLRDYTHLACYDRYGKLSWMRTENIHTFPGNMIIDFHGNIYVETRIAAGPACIASLSSNGDPRFSFYSFETNRRPIIGTNKTLYAAGHRLLNTVRLWGESEWKEEWKEGGRRYDFPVEVSVSNKGLLQGDNGIIYAAGACRNYYDEGESMYPLFAFDQEANVVWTYGDPSLTCLSSPVMDNTGTFYVLMYNETQNRTAVHAIRTSATGLALSDWPMFRADPGRTNCQPGYIRLP
jgi:hypothetical protein